MKYRQSTSNESEDDGADSLRLGEVADLVEVDAPALVRADRVPLHVEQVAHPPVCVVSLIADQEPTRT